MSPWMWGAGPTPDLGQGDAVLLPSSRPSGVSHDCPPGVSAVCLAAGSPC